MAGADGVLCLALDRSRFILPDMGFDVECIVDAHTYPREYFCLFCQTLVFPSEALQTLCTHLYCKPCLTYVANGTGACPYHGTSVTETEPIIMLNYTANLECLL